MKKKVLIVVGIIVVILAAIGTIFLIKINKKKVVSYDTFTDVELDGMEYVDKTISNFMKENNSKNISVEEKSSKLEEVLKQLKKDKYIKNYQFDKNGQSVSFEYECGVLGGIQLQPFDDKLN